MILTLDQLPKRKRAKILAISAPETIAIEKRLLEIGFVEGAPVMLLHEAPFSKDPLIVRLRNNRIAIRRNEAQYITVELQE
jgi:ferrous iron transport protein A